LNSVYTQQIFVRYIAEALTLVSTFSLTGYALREFHNRFVPSPDPLSTVPILNTYMHLYYVSVAPYMVFETGT